MVRWFISSRKDKSANKYMRESGLMIIFMDTLKYNTKLEKNTMASILKEKDTDMDAWTTLMEESMLALG